MWKILFIAFVANTFLTAASSGCNGDANATRGCDKECVMRCPSTSEASCRCPENSCECKPGFVFDFVSFSCILPQDCPSDNDDDGDDICYLPNDDETTTNSFSISNCYPTECPSALERLRRALITFSFETLYLFAVQNPMKSFFGSAQGIFFFLFQLIFFSVGNQYDELLNAVMLKNKDEVGCVCNSLNTDVSKLPTNGFTSGSDLIADCEFPFTNYFKNVMETVIIGEARNYNLSSPHSPGNVNNLIKTQTGGRISNVITPPTLFNSNTQMGFVRGLFFLMPWKYAFDPKDVKQDYFMSSPNKNDTTQYLNQKEIFNYTESVSLKTRFIEIPYNSSGLTLILGLPIEPFTEAEPLQQLKNSNVYDSVLESMKPTLVNVSFPVLNNSYLWNTVKSLKQTGNISSIFNRDTAQYDCNAFVGVVSPPIVNFARQRLNILTTLQGGQNARQNFSASEQCVIFNANYRSFFIITLNKIPLISGYIGGIEQQQCTFDNNN